MASYCECRPADQEVVKTVPWQHDFCNRCGQPISDDGAPEQ